MIDQAGQATGTGQSSDVYTELDEYLDQLLNSWMEDEDGEWDEQIDALYVALAMLRFHQSAVRIIGAFSVHPDDDREKVRLIVDAARSVGKQTQDWTVAEQEMTNNIVVAMHAGYFRGNLV